MKIFTLTTTCDICGGDGEASTKTIAAQYRMEGVVRHTDPRICQMNLETKKHSQQQNKQQP